MIANNLANVSTTGFALARVRGPAPDAAPASAVLATTEAPVGLEIGLGTRAVATARNFSAGNMQSTGAPLDLAIDGDGFFQVALPDGTIGYTRAGNFQADSTGQIVTPNGYPVQPAMTIPANALSVTIGKDGIVSITQAGQAAPTQVGTVQLVSFINPGGLQSFGDNLYLETAASGTPTTGTPGSNGLGLLNQGYLETSNVNMVEELVLMIQTQRAYEINSKVITTSDQMLARLTQL